MQASHNGVTFQPNRKYTLNNDRKYSNPLNQGKIVTAASAENFNPSLLITDNPDAINGPMITTEKKMLLAGDGRTQILHRVYNSNPKGAAAYRAMLADKASRFGLDAADLAGMKKPVLTRVISDAELEAKEGGAQRAITDFNKVGTASLTPAERAIADSRHVSAATLDDLGGRLDAKGSDATLAQALDGRGGVEVLNNLIKDGVVTPQERAAFASSDELTAAGRDRVSKLVLGRFFDSPEQLDTIPASIRGKVERVAAPLAQVEGRGGWSLTEPMRDALGILHQADRLGVKNVDDFLQQDGLFGKEKYSPQAVRLAQVLQKMKATDVQAAARQYAQDAAFAAKGSNSLLGAAPTPAESFRDAFGKAPANALADHTRGATQAIVDAKRESGQGGFLRLGGDRPVLNALAREGDGGGGGGGTALNSLAREGGGKPSVKDFVANLEKRFPVLIDLSESRGNDLNLASIRLAKENRSQGIGSQVMREITSYADSAGKRLTLTPSTDFGASSVSRLRAFYKRFDFVDNSGRHKDFTTRDTMIRNPQNHR